MGQMYSTLHYEEPESIEPSLVRVGPRLPIPSMDNINEIIEEFFKCDLQTQKEYLFILDDALDNIWTLALIGNSKYVARLTNFICFELNEKEQQTLLIHSNRLGWNILMYSILLDSWVMTRIVDLLHNLDDQASYKKIMCQTNLHRDTVLSLAINCKPMVTTYLMQFLNKIKDKKSVLKIISEVGSIEKKLWMMIFKTDPTLFEETIVAMDNMDKQLEVAFDMLSVLGKHKAIPNKQGMLELCCKIVLDGLRMSITDNNKALTLQVINGIQNVRDNEIKYILYTMVNCYGSNLFMCTTGCLDNNLKKILFNHAYTHENEALILDVLRQNNSERQNILSLAHAYDKRVFFILVSIVAVLKNSSAQKYFAKQVLELDKRIFRNAYKNDRKPLMTLLNALSKSDRELKVTVLRNDKLLLNAVKSNDIKMVCMVLDIIKSLRNEKFFINAILAKNKSSSRQATVVHYNALQIAMCSSNPVEIYLELINAINALSDEKIKDKIFEASHELVGWTPEKIPSSSWSSKNSFFSAEPQKGVTWGDVDNEPAPNPMQ